MSIYGTSAPRFIYSTTIDYIPTDFYVMPKSEFDNKDIVRNSILSSDTKYFEKGTYFLKSYQIFNKSKAESDILKTMIGEVIDFYPHSDEPYHYNAIVLGVKTEMRKGRATQYTTVISTISESYEYYKRIESFTSTLDRYILDFNGTNQYVDTGFKPSDIVDGNPLNLKECR